MKKNNYLFGFFLLFLGILFILINFELININWEKLWPFFLLIPGILFEVSYFIFRKDAGLLVPGGILITYGLLFFMNSLYGWQMMEKLWPIFPLGVAIGLFQLYFFGNREKELLIPIGILTGVSLFFIINNFISINFGLLVGSILIVAGLWIIVKKVK